VPLFGLAVLVVLAAGCGGAAAPSGGAPRTTTTTTSTSTGSSPTTSGTVAAGLGATEAQWSAAHGGSGRTGTGVRDSAAVTRGGRVVGWTMTFSSGTSIATALTQVDAQLPPDARQTASHRATFPHSSDICEMVTFESASLGTTLGASRDTVGVVLDELGADGKGSTSIAVVDHATIRVPAAAAARC